MNTHKTFFGKIFGTAWDSIKGMFQKTIEAANHDFLQAAILVTNVVKTALSSGAAQFLVDLTKTDIDNKLLATANQYLPVLLADEIMLQGITTASTEEEVQAAYGKVLDSFGKMSDSKKEEFYTSLAANIYKVYQEIESGKKITFGEAALLVETAYQEWLNSK